MRAHLIDKHLLVPRSRSSAKVKVKYQGHVSQKMGVSGALVFHKYILFVFDMVENIVGKGENARFQHFVYFPLYFQRDFNSGLLKVGIVW